MNDKYKSQIDESLLYITIVVTLMSYIVIIHSYADLRSDREVEYTNTNDIFYIFDIAVKHLLSTYECKRWHTL